MDKLDELDRVAGAALTRQERRVLDFVAQGLTDREVAGRLGIAEATVHKHLEHAYRKLQVTNRVAATLAVRSSGR